MSIKEGFVVSLEASKKKIIQNEEEIKNYIFLTYENLLNKYYGQCKKNALFSLCDKYSISYDLAKEFMRYIPYVENKVYCDEKLDSLVSAKNYLEKNNLLECDPFFIYQLKQFPITFLDVRETNEFHKLVSSLSKITEVHISSLEDIHKENQVFEYKSIEDEAYDVANEIKKLHKNGIPYSKIHILNMTSDYLFIFRRLSKSYNIPIAFKPNKNILHTRFAKEFLSLLETKDSFNEILKELSDSIFIDSLMQLITSYSIENEKPIEYIDFFKKEFKNFSYKEDIYQDMVNISSDISFLDDEYVFYLGLNQGISPKIYKDEDYLSDYQKEILAIPTSIEKNKEERINLISLLKKTKNIHASYSLRIGIKEMFPSGIIEEYGFKVVKKQPLYGYSAKEDKLRLGIALSIYDKTHELNPALDYYDTKELSYNTYDNSFKGIDKSHMENRFKEDESLSLSYSTMKYYFECPFHYYAEKILDLASYDQTCATRLGTYSHAVLEDSYQEDFDFLTSTKKNLETGLEEVDIKEYQKDKFYFEQMNEVLKDLIEFNQRHEKESSLDKVECETHISYVSGNLKFHGYIDKLLYTELYGEIYAAIIDYKTGKDIISLDNVEHGFNLQLSSYMYLLSKYEKFEGKKIHIIGIYLQKVNMIALDNSIDIKEQREKSFRLHGFTIADKSLILKFDPNFNKSDYIASMMTLKDGSFGRYAKVIKEKEEEKLIELVDKHIHKVRDGIMNAKFNISPKKIDNKDKSCTFCKYKDLCFKKYEDYMNLEEKKFQEQEER